MASLCKLLKRFAITSNPLKIRLTKGVMKTEMSVLSSVINPDSQRLFSSEPSIVLTKPNLITVDINPILKNVELDSIVSDDLKHLVKDNESALDECKEDLSEITPYINDSYNLVAFVNKSQTLQELVKLGVNLHKLERRKDVPEFLLRLNFEENIKGHLRFLHDVGVPADEFGIYLTKNPFILKEDLEDMQIRINYLQSKKFTKDMIARIISKNPKWLSLRVIEIDKRLGFFQRTFILSGEEVREVATKRPALITYRRNLIEQSVFSVKEEMGFSAEEMKQLLLAKPKLFTISSKHLKDRFDFVHNQMKISHERIIAQPSVLLTREYIIKERHLFLQSLGRNQYDPKLPGYVSLDMLVKPNDIEFCQDVAKTSVYTFNMFLKSL